MNTWQLAVRNALYFRRTNAAVLAAVAVATAVITGALVVGDSVRVSLRRLALDRLGPYEAALVTDHYFREATAQEWQAVAAAEQEPVEAEPLIVLPSVTVELRRSTLARRATEVSVYGVRPSFWRGNIGMDANRLRGNEVVLNRQLADELGALPGDEITLRLPKAAAVPAESTLAQKRDRVINLPRMRVAEIIENQGLGRFSLALNQALPRNVYITLPTLQQALDLPTEINAVLVARRDLLDQPELVEARALRYNRWLRPRLADLGLRLEQVRRTFSSGGQETVIYAWYQLTSRRMILEPELSEALTPVIRQYGGFRIMTYLADSIRRDPPSEGAAVEVPYSLISGVENHSPYLQLLGQPQLADQDIVLNRWAADRLGARPGDRIVVEYFEPESTHGTPQLRRASFTLRDIVPLTEPVEPYRRQRLPLFREPPTVFNDPDLTPTVEGITDQESIEDWEAPFPFDIRRVTRYDDQYWQNHRTTPKAFVSLEVAQRLWGSRFGKETSVRFPVGEQENLSRLGQALEEALGEPAALSRLGFVFQPVRAEVLRGSAGTTPFDALFLGLSSFLVVSALLLVALLFRLGVELRSNHLGLLGACGWPMRRVAGVFLSEGFLVAVAGSAIGLPLAVGYSSLVIAGLRSPRWWLGAIGTPFLELVVTYRSLGIGYVAGLAVCVAVIALMTWRLYRMPPRWLLSGQVTTAKGMSIPATRRWFWLGWLLVVPALGLAAWSTQLEAEAQAGGFVMAGFLLLAAALAWQRVWLGRSREDQPITLRRLAMGNAARHPTRSSLTIGLMASATFLIVAMGAFRVRPSERGTGGFELIGQCSIPIYEPLELAPIHPESQTNPNSVPMPEVFALRVQPGDDASCRNLYRVTRPRVLGVPRQLALRYDRSGVSAFSWTADSMAGTPNPWHRLWEDGETSVPVILDANTAIYSLHWTGGVGSEHVLEWPTGLKVRLRIVALLSNTVLQGSLLVAEERFKELFPDVNGYQYFLVDVAADQLERCRRSWESYYSDQGLAFRNAERVLEELLAVQNTYLSTFQTLGALGVLLGTLGVAAVQARSMFERRGELALLQALGFARLRLSQLVLAENLVLLLAGMGTGTLSAVAAVLPYVFLASATFPMVEVAMLLAIILLAGLISSAVCLTLVLRSELLPALRSE